MEDHQSPISLFNLNKVQGPELVHPTPTTLFRWTTEQYGRGAKRIQNLKNKKNTSALRSTSLRSVKPMISRLDSKLPLDTTLMEKWFRMGFYIHNRLYYIILALSFIRGRKHKLTKFIFTPSQFGGARAEGGRASVSHPIWAFSLPVLQSLPLLLILRICSLILFVCFLCWWWWWWLM